VDSFFEQASRLKRRLQAEQEAGCRNPATDAELEVLRSAWRGMDTGTQSSVRATSEEIAALVSARPPESDPPQIREPAQPERFGPEPPSNGSGPEGRPSTPVRTEHAPSRTPGHGTTGDEAEAVLALKGLDRIQEHEPRQLRPFEGAPDPEQLLDHMGYDTFRPGQSEAVAAALGGEDCLVVMPTGGGKSLCYQLPGLAGPDLTIVVSPLIALMADQVRRLRREGHPAVMFASGLPDEISAASREAVLDGSARLAYCSPERFGSSAFMELIATRRVDLLAIDEAHCVSEWGHDFRPDYLRLPRVADRLGRPPVMACTATATPQVAREIISRMGMGAAVEVHSGFDRPNLSFDTVLFEGGGSKSRKAALLEAGLAEDSNRPAIVYCGTRRDTEEVADQLRSAGISAVAYHAGMAPDDRASAQVRFMDDDVEVVAATNAFGMGIDKADVRSVWHWAIPSSVEAYYQEAGRAGRDGKPARAVLLAMRSDLGRLVRFNQRRKVEPDRVIAFVDSIRRGADGDGSAVTNAPREEAERALLAVAERAGLLSFDPAPGGQLMVQVADGYDPGTLTAACRVAEDRGWQAYRAVESFTFSDRCRRRQLLEHFGDESDPKPNGRCCDVCDPDDTLPDPGTMPVRRRAPSSRKRAQAEAPTLSSEDEALFERLREWRLAAADGRPAFQVASNRTLAAIAAARPADEGALLAIPGVGPAFMEKYSAEVLRIVSG
jgi:ATP-dependent DNA helicase RecQ